MGVLPFSLVWLVRLGALKQLGYRGEYVLNDGQALGAIVNAAWPELGSGRSEHISDSFAQSQRIV